MHHHSHRTLRVDDRDFKHAVEEALQWVEEAEQRPKLSLVRCDDESSVEDLVLCQGEPDAQGAGPEAVETPSQDDASAEAELFAVGDHSATEDLILCEPPEARTQMLQLSLGSGVLNVEPPAEAAAVAPEESSETISPTLPFHPAQPKAIPSRPGKTPERIGRGKLVAARLTWKPGDPFGDGRPRPVERFSWESMLTSACITAACGLVCVWLLHSILA